MFVRCAFILTLTVGSGLSCAYAQTVPAGFDIDVAASGFNHPVALAFAPDGRIFVAEQDGFVWVVEQGMPRPTPFIDLADEINSPQDRGLLGLALDPDFAANRHVYLLYTVDPIFGPPDESKWDGAWGRLTRYTGTAASNGAEADPVSRTVLLGDAPASGFPVCEPSHTVGSLVFGFDGSLFVTAGDGAHFNAMDDGGLDPECFGEGGLFESSEDVGAFRAQSLDSLAGKVLRINPANGDGYADNPHFDGDVTSNRSRIWANGLRNPYRAALRPGSPSPGTLYVGDVGWHDYEEINVATGGENFGWPCYESALPHPDYSTIGAPAHSGCETIESPTNPGALTLPLISWHHTDPLFSTPTGYTGRATVGGAFYETGCFPPEYHHAFFLADYVHGWINVLTLAANDQFVSLNSFATGFDRPTTIAAHPETGDLYIPEYFNGEIRRIYYQSAPPVEDLDGDCLVGVTDLLTLLSAWGPCEEPCPPTPCLGDVNNDCAVNVTDLLQLLSDWSR